MSVNRGGPGWVHEPVVRAPRAAFLLSAHVPGRPPVSRTGASARSHHSHTPVHRRCLAVDFDCGTRDGSLAQSCSCASASPAPAASGATTPSAAPATTASPNPDGTVSAFGTPSSGPPESSALTVQVRGAHGRDLCVVAAWEGWLGQGGPRTHVGRCSELVVGGGDMPGCLCVRGMLIPEVRRTSGRRALDSHPAPSCLETPRPNSHSW